MGGEEGKRWRRESVGVEIAEEHLVLSQASATDTATPTVPPSIDLGEDSLLVLWQGSESDPVLNLGVRRANGSERMRVWPGVEFMVES